jgi:metallo-beta-lactamase class B
MFPRLLIALTLFTGTLFAQINPDWTTPLPPHRIIGNIYYVGSKDLASYLIVTPQGDILINGNLTTSPPQIRHSVEQLGFRFSDIKILLISHAHSDHAGGSATIKQMTHAQYMVMDADVPVIESGGRADFQFGHSPDMYFPATKVDRVLHDGSEVRLGDTVLAAHLTPGHTKGCTTWTLKVRDHGHVYNVVIVGSASVLSDYNLVHNVAYPQIATDYERTFRVLRSLPCDVFLGAHGGFFGLLEKYPHLKAGGPNPYIDPAGYKSYVADSEQDFYTDLKKQQAAAQQ